MTTDVERLVNGELHRDTPCAQCGDPAGQHIAVRYTDLVCPESFGEGTVGITTCTFMDPPVVELSHQPFPQSTIHADVEKAFGPDGVAVLNHLLGDVEHTYCSKCETPVGAWLPRHTSRYVTWRHVSLARLGRHQPVVLLCERCTP